MNLQIILYMYISPLSDSDVFLISQAHEYNVKLQIIIVRLTFAMECAISFDSIRSLHGVTLRYNINEKALDVQ